MNNDKPKELMIDALPENLDRVLDFIKAELNTDDLKTQRQIAVVVEEVFINIAYYAYTPQKGMVIIRAARKDKELFLEFEDAGNPYNPLERADPDITASVTDRPIGGLGIFMVKKIMDTVEYRFEDRKNILTLTKKIG